MEKDSNLKNINEITERIKSIDRQIDKLDKIWNPKDFNKHHNKYIKLNNRKDILWIHRAKLLRNNQ